MESSETRCISYWEEEECSLVWTITNFSRYTMEDNLMVSSEFSNSSTPLTRWYLSLYPFGREKDNNVSLYLYPKTISTGSIMKVDCKMSIIDKYNKEFQTNKFTHTFKVGEGNGYPSYISRENLLKNNDLLPNDTLTISCKVCVYIKKKEKVLNNEAPENSKHKYNLLSLLQSKFRTDITLLVENKEIAAHKNILSSQSDVFLAMFCTEMEEQKTSRVDIKDLTFEAVTQMVRFCYGSEVPPYGEKSEALLKAADKYLVKGLICELENQMIKSLTLSNACRLLIVAHTYNLASVKEYIKKFIFIEHLEAFKNLNILHQLEKVPVLVAEVNKLLVTSYKKVTSNMK